MSEHKVKNGPAVNHSGGYGIDEPEGIAQRGAKGDAERFKQADAFMDSKIPAIEALQSGEVAPVEDEPTGNARKTEERPEHVPADGFSVNLSHDVKLADKAKVDELAKEDKKAKEKAEKDAADKAKLEKDAKAETKKNDK